MVEDMSWRIENNNTMIFVWIEPKYAVLIQSKMISTYDIDFHGVYFVSMIDDSTQSTSKMKT